MILAIDPGKTTGVCMLDVTATTSGSVITRPLAIAMAPHDFFDALAALLEPVDRVAIEKFTISIRTVKGSRQHDALDIIGAVKYATHQRDIPLAVQTPADAKNAFSDATLRQLDLWDSSVHVRDATRHALLAARRGGHHVHVVV